MFPVTRRQFGDRQHKNHESEAHSEHTAISDAGRQDGGAVTDLRCAHGGKEPGTRAP